MTQEELFQTILLYATNHKAGAFVLENAFSATLFALRTNISTLLETIADATNTEGMVKRKTMSSIISDVQDLINDLDNVQMTCVQVRKLKLAPERSGELTGELLRELFDDFGQKLTTALEVVKKRQAGSHQKNYNSDYYAEPLSVEELSDALVDLNAKLGQLDDNLSSAIAIHRDIYANIVKNYPDYL